MSRFLGIIISFYYDEHNPPRFHELKIQEGSLPKKVIALVLEWAYEHRDELINDWELAQQGQTPIK